MSLHGFHFSLISNFTWIRSIKFVIGSFALDLFGNTGPCGVVCTCLSVPASSICICFLFLEVCDCLQCFILFLCIWVFVMVSIFSLQASEMIRHASISSVAALLSNLRSHGMFGKLYS